MNVSHKQNIQMSTTPPPPLTLTRCEATTNSIKVFFSQPVVFGGPAGGSYPTGSAVNPACYKVYDPNTSSGFSAGPTTLPAAATITYDDSHNAVTIAFSGTPPPLSKGDWVTVLVTNVSPSDTAATGIGSSGQAIGATVDGKGQAAAKVLRIVNCVATPTNITVYFSEPLDTPASGSPNDPNAGTNYPTQSPPGTPVNLQADPAGAKYDSFQRATVLQLQNPLVRGQWVVVTVNNLSSGGVTVADGGNNTFSTRVNGGGPPDGGAGGGQVAANGGARDVGDLQSFPVLTEEVPAGVISGAGGPATGRIAGGPSSLGQTADQAIREVLSLRTRPDDAKGFLAALSQSFDLKQVEGHTEFTWTPRSYTVQTDLGAVTGAQASIYTRAKVALDQSLPLLDGLYPLVPNVEPEDLASVQAVVRTQFTALVNEFGVVGGPRVPRVDELFELLLGPGTPTNPEDIRTAGSLGLVRQRFGLERRYVVTVDDEQNLTNYIILVDYVIGLKQSWNYEKSFFVRIRGGEGEVERQPFFGTQLVLIARALDVVAQGVQDAYFAMDSVFMSDAERQTSQLDFAGLTVQLPERTGSKSYTFYPDTSGLFVAELMDWVDRAASQELPGLLKDAGKDGLESFKAATNRLRAFVRAAIPPPYGPQVARGLPPGYKTPRVTRAMQLLRDGLDEAYLLAFQVPSAEFPADVSQRDLSSIWKKLNQLEEQMSD